MEQLLEDGRFRLLFLGQAASMVGESMMLIVLAIWVKSLTGSNGLAGAVMLAIMVPSLLAPLLGWAVDRVRRRPFLVWVSIGSALALTPLFAVDGRSDVWIIYAVAGAYGFSFVLVSAGMNGLLVEVVPGEKLGDANGALRTVREGLRLVGPIAGAGLYSLVGPSAVITADIASFLIAAVTLGVLKVQEGTPSPVERGWMREAAGGFRHLFADVPLRNTALATGVALLVFGTTESGIFAFTDALNREPTFVGILVAVMGVGSIVGGILAPAVIRRVGEVGTVAAGLLLLALSLWLLIYPGIPSGVAAMPLMGLGVALIVVAFPTLLQRRTPSHLLGRVSTAADLLTGGPQAASIAAGAILVSVLDYRLMFAVSGVIVSLAACALWAVRHQGAHLASTPEGCTAHEPC